MPTNRQPCVNGCTNWRKNFRTAYRRTLKRSTALEWNNHKDAGESGRGLSVSVFVSRQARRARQDSDLRKTLARKCSKQTDGEIPLPRSLRSVAGAAASGGGSLITAGSLSTESGDNRDRTCGQKSTTKKGRGGAVFP